MLHIPCQQLATHLSLHVKYPTFCATVTKFRVSRQFSLQDPTINIHKNLSGGGGADAYGQTDGHNDAKSLFSLFMRKRREVKLIIFMCFNHSDSYQLHWFHFQMENYETYPTVSETLILLQVY